MVGSKIGAGIVGAILVVADGDDEIGVRWCGESVDELFQRDAADLCGAGEVSIVGNGVGNLRQGKERVAGHVARGARRKAREPAAECEVIGRRASGLQSDRRSGLRIRV